MLVAKQAASLDRLSGGPLRLGIGVGKDPAEYEAMGAYFCNCGAHCEEQMALQRRLWSEETIYFEGGWHTNSGAGRTYRPHARGVNGTAWNLRLSFVSMRKLNLARLAGSVLEC